MGAVLVRASEVLQVPLYTVMVFVVVVAVGGGSCQVPEGG